MLDTALLFLLSVLGSVYCQCADDQPLMPITTLFREVEANSMFRKSFTESASVCNTTVCQQAARQILNAQINMLPSQSLNSHAILQRLEALEKELKEQNYKLEEQQSRLELQEQALQTCAFQHNETLAKFVGVQNAVVALQEESVAQNELLQETFRTCDLSWKEQQDRKADIDTLSAELFRLNNQWQANVSAVEHRLENIHELWSNFTSDMRESSASTSSLSERMSQLNESVIETREAMLNSLSHVNVGIQAIWHRLTEWNATMELERKEARSTLENETTTLEDRLMMELSIVNKTADVDSLVLKLADLNDLLFQNVTDMNNRLYEIQEASSSMVKTLRSELTILWNNESKAVYEDLSTINMTLSNRIATVHDQTVWEVRHLSESVEAQDHLIFLSINYVQQSLTNLTNDLAELNTTMQKSMSSIGINCAVQLFPSDRFALTSEGQCSCRQGRKGPDCRSCQPGYFGSNCSQCTIDCNGHGECSHGVSGDGSCNCTVGWTGINCQDCESNFYGEACTPCDCSDHGLCNDGRYGDGACACETGWAGVTCDVKLFQYSQKLLAPDGFEYDYLGRGGPAISANGTVMAAAAHLHDEQGQSSGSLYVWLWNETMDKYVFKQKLSAPDGSADDYLGLGGPTLSANAATLAAAAWGNDDKGSSSGSLYVWLWDAGTQLYVHRQTLLASDGGSNDNLGYGGPILSTDGSFLVAGAHGDDDKDTDSGAVYVWIWVPGTQQFVFQQKLSAPDGAASANLGLGRPALNTNASILAAGAHGDGSYRGALYVWVWNNGTKQFDYKQKLLASDGTASDYLGRGGAAMSGAGLVLSAGAHGDDDSGLGSGSLYVWVWNDGRREFEFRQKLTTHDGAAGDNLGHGGPAITVDGSTLAAAADYDDDTGSNSGSVYVWTWNSATQQFVFLQKVIAPDGVASDYLGEGGPMFSGDGSILAAGADYSDPLGPNSGSLYVWLR